MIRPLGRSDNRIFCKVDGLGVEFHFMIQIETMPPLD